MPDIFILREDGREIARHSTRRACVVETYERRLALHLADSYDCLADGVTITREKDQPHG